MAYVTYEDKDNDYLRATPVDGPELLSLELNYNNVEFIGEI